MSQTSILLADDDSEDQELFERIAPGAGTCRLIDVVWDGQEVLTWLNQCPDGSLPQLLILDFQMPVLTAVEVLDRLRLNTRYDAIHKWSGALRPAGAY